MAAIRIKIGAALDANAATVFQPIEKAAQRARANIDKALNEAAKSTDKVAKASKSSGDALDRELERMANKILSDEEKSQAKRTRVVEREAKERARLERQAAAEVERINDRVRIGRERDAAAGRRFLGSVGGGLGTSMRLVRGGASMAAGFAEELLQGIGLDTSIASHMGRAADFSQRISQVVNAGYIPGAAGAQGQLQNTAAVAMDVKAAANASAFDYSEAAEGLQKFVGLTGDLETGRATLKQTAELARATGSDFIKMSEASAEVANHLGNVPNKAQAVGAVMRVIAGQGKLGALEIKDFAKQMAKIAANAPQFEGDIAKTIGELGLIAQESKMSGGSASAAQAATAVLAFSRDFAKKTTFGHWQAAGLNPFTDKTHTRLRSPEELILEAVKYSKGDQLKLAQLFPSAMAVRAVRPFTNIYSETRGTEKEKLEAVTHEFDRMRAAQLDETEVLRAHAQAMSENKNAIQIANNKLDDLAGDMNTALRPAIAALVPSLSAMIPVVGQLVTNFANLLGDLFGLNKKKAAADAEKATGKLAEDERLLESTKKEQYVEGKGMVPVYSAEALENIRTHGQKRAEAIGELQGEIPKAEKSASEFGLASKLDVFGINAKVADFFGIDSYADKASKDKADAVKMVEQQRRALEEQHRSNELLSRVESAILKGNALREKRAPVAHPVSTGVAPAESEP